NNINNKDHITEKGLIVYIKAFINNGLFNKLTKIFPDIKKVARPNIIDRTIKDPN
ncbi:hypothetical protein ASPBRDRAFT_139982, partial [Aspergillus brasiliensis CBS 101740]